MNSVNYYLGAVPKVIKLKIKNVPIKCMQLSRCQFMSMSSLHCRIMFHMYMNIYIGVTQRSTPILLLIGWDWKSIGHGKQKVNSRHVTWHQHLCKVTDCDGMCYFYIYCDPRDHKHAKNVCNFSYRDTIRAHCPGQGHALRS